MSGTTPDVYIVDWAPDGECCGWCPCTLEQVYQQSVAGRGGDCPGECGAAAWKSIYSAVTEMTYTVCEAHFADTVAYIEALPGFIAGKSG